jgi:hypothetical protein
MMIRTTDHRFDEALCALEDVMFLGGLMNAGRFGYLPLCLTAIQPKDPLPSDFERDIEARSLVWRTFAETGNVDRQLLDNLRFSYIKAAMSRSQLRDLKFLFNQRRHIARRIRERRHGFLDLARYGLRKVTERTRRH